MGKTAKLKVDSPGRRQLCRGKVHFRTGNVVQGKSRRKNIRWNRDALYSSESAPQLRRRDLHAKS